MVRAPAAAATEPLPEADRLEGFRHPRETIELVGHLEAQSLLGHALASGRIHHAWLLTGPRGIGKATLAYRFARCALAPPALREPETLSVTADCPALHQVSALSHPDLLVLRRPYDTKAKRFAGSISVDEVRRLRAFLGHHAGEGAWRVVIVDQADDMNVNAANALLKSLEEPPPLTIFLLISSEPGRLLATIASRCCTLELAPLAPEELRKAAVQALEAAGRPTPGDEEWQRLAALADGSVRRLLSLAQTGGLELSERIEKMLRALPEVDWVAAHTLADRLAPNQAEQQLETFFALLLDRLARLIRARTLVSLAASPDAELARTLIRPETLATWAELWETLVRDKAEVMLLNLDRRTLVLETLARLSAAAASGK
ncbi:MAG: DNA polymerase III subunit delta' [Hyphomicrobiaceae bacterium]